MKNINAPLILLHLFVTSCQCVRLQLCVSANSYSVHNFGYVTGLREKVRGALRATVQRWKGVRLNL